MFSIKKNNKQFCKHTHTCVARFGVLHRYGSIYNILYFILFYFPFLSFIALRSHHHRIAFASSSHCVRMNIALRSHSVRIVFVCVRIVFVCVRIVFVCVRIHTNHPLQEFARPPPHPSFPVVRNIYIKFTTSFNVVFSIKKVLSSFVNIHTSALHVLACNIDTLVSPIYFPFLFFSFLSFVAVC